MATRSRTELPVVTAEHARGLLLDRQGLCDDPTGRATAISIHRRIDRMGFVQVDTINIVERAHHHILMTRLDGYRRDMLTRLLERDRRLFEHWTHDASLIPTTWLPYWRRRFRRYREGALDPGTWWTRRMGGEPQRVIRHVRRRIDREGPLMSRDFEHEPGDEGGPWWGWKPRKAALEYLWRVGELTVSGRVNFHKVYDLTGRVFPDATTERIPTASRELDWACSSALERLGVATPSELAGFWRAIDLADARAWCTRATRTGRAVPVLVKSVNGAKPREAVADPNWRAEPRPAPERARLLSPFDPVIRDRARAERLFGLDYRFEAFVPAPKRRYGYYVMPILEGDRFVGRLDPKHHRDAETLEVRGFWWEPDVRPTKKRRAAVLAAIERFAQQIGAGRVQLPKGRLGG